MRYRIIGTAFIFSLLNILSKPYLYIEKTNAHRYFLSESFIDKYIEFVPVDEKNFISVTVNLLLQKLILKKN